MLYLKFSLQYESPCPIQFNLLLKIAITLDPIQEVMIMADYVDDDDNQLDSYLLLPVGTGNHFSCQLVSFMDPLRKTWTVLVYGYGSSQSKVFPLICYILFL